DPNGDSLVTEIINPLTGSNCNTPPSNISFNSASPSFSIPGNPIQTGNSFITNPTTGEITFTPTTTGSGTVAIKVKEYRNGTLIGYVMRDIQIHVLNGCTTNPPTLAVSPGTV